MTSLHLQSNTDLIDEMRDAFFVLDAEWRFIYVNRTAENVLRVPRIRLLGRNLWEEFPAALASEFERQYRSVMEHRQVAQFEAYYPEPLNEWYDTTATPYLNGIAVQFRSLSATKQALREREEHYRSLFEHHPDAVGISGLDGSIVSVNESMVSMFGYTEEELIDMGWGRLCPEENREVLNRHFHEAIAGVPRKLETYGYGKHGERLELHVTFVPIRDGDATTGVFILSKDITERKQAEERLRDSESNLKRTLARLEETERLFRLISENSQDAITLSTPEGEVIYMSPGVTSLVGFAPEDVVGKQRASFYHEDDRRNIGVPDGQERFVSRNRARHKDGHYVWVETSNQLIRDETGRVVNVLGIGRNISERVKAEELMVKTEKLKLTGQLAAGIAHEIRNPLTAIKGFLHMMRAGRPSKPEYVDVMSAELGRIEEIVNELLLLAKPNRTYFARRNLVEIARQVVTLMETEANLQGTEIHLVGLPGELWIDCDENQLKQVFINFVKNGLEAMPGGGRLVIELARNGEEAVAAFADQGEGIPADVLARIGQPFFTTKEKGTGLGLAVSITILESHRGAVSFDSALGRGTTVTVRLPLLPASHE